jgi:hypothetical protein
VFRMKNGQCHIGYDLFFVLVVTQQQDHRTHVRTDRDLSRESQKYSNNGERNLVPELHVKSHNDVKNRWKLFYGFATG